MARYDSIIIGAGHNGLVCAAYLAQSGQRVLVLEASDRPGGLASSREFHPGFHTSIAHSLGHFSATVARELRLGEHGLDSTPAEIATVGLGTDGRHVVVRGDTVENVGAEDAAAFRRYRELMQTFAAALAPSWEKTMPRIGSNSFRELATFASLGLRLRRMGKKDMREFMRIATLPTRDIMDEFFDDPLLKATLSWDGLIGSKMAPLSPNSAVLALLYRMSGESQGMHTIPAGGVSALTNALAASAESAGAEIRLQAPVECVIVTGSEAGLLATGIRLADGDEVHADRVISATDPKRTFVDLVGVEHLDIGFTNRIRRLRCDGYVAKLHLALDGLPAFAGLDQPDSRMIIAPDMDAIEFAFDHAKYGGCPSAPVLECVVPTLHDPAHAPGGQHVLSAHVMYVPYELKDGWTDEARQRMCDASIDTIARYAPAIRDQIIASEFLTPADLEREYRVTGGHWHHTEFAADQLLMMRPTYEAAQYRTPIPGLFLCSAGCHPAGDIVGAAGLNAAREILR